MREIITRFGRHNIGFAWLFGEPMLFTSGVILLWNMMEGNSSHNIDVTSYAITSYSTVLVWRNTIGRCTTAIEPNRSLLAHRYVRPIDFFIARVILELCGVTISALALITFFVATGLIPPPVDILIMLKGWALLCWYATAMAFLIGALSEYSEMVERLWHPISYFQLPISGAFAMASWLPPKIRHIVLLFPVPNCVEVFREGYYGDAIRPYYDVPYVCTVCLILTWIGLLLVRAASRRIDAQ
jgi:capsular polysaccharide transport system permease protein